MKWHLLDHDDLPSVECLLTNNLHATNRWGQMSHLWIGLPQTAHDARGVFAYRDELTTMVQSLTHWAPLPTRNGRYAEATHRRAVRRERAAETALEILGAGR